MDDKTEYYSLKKLANTYKTLEKYSPPGDHDFVIYAHYLYSEPVDGVHGKQIYLCGFPTRKKALDVVADIIEKTGHRCIYVAERSSWEDIDEKHRPDRTIYSDPGKSDDLDRQYRQDILKEAEEEEERIKISEELDEQVQKELDPTTVEHYAHNWFNAIRNKATLEYHKEQVKYYQKHYDARVGKIRTQYNDNPEVDSTWLDIYEKRLKARKEEDIFIMMKTGYEKLKDLIIGKIDQK